MKCNALDSDDRANWGRSPISRLPERKNAVLAVEPLDELNDLSWH